MMMISGIAASRVRKPRMMSTPQVTRRRRRTDPSARDREYQYWQSGPHQNFGEHKLRNPFGEKHDKANHQANKMVQPSARVWSRSTHRLIAAPPSTSSGRSYPRFLVLEQLAKKFAHLELGGRECPDSCRRGTIDPPSGAARTLLFRSEEPFLFQPVQDGIEGAGAHLLAVAAELLDHGQAVKSAP